MFFYICAFYSVQLPRWKNKSPREVMHIYENAFHKIIRKNKNISKLCVTQLSDLPKHWRKCIY
jgi:hypothetical protein